MTDAPTEAKPFRRAVFFTHGYHDDGWPYFHRQLRKCIGQHELLYGRRIDLEVDAVESVDGPTAHLRTMDEGRCVETEYHFLDWSDIVRAEQAETIARTWPVVLGGLVRMIFGGGFWRAYRIFWGQANVFIYSFFGVLLFVTAGASLFAGAVLWFDGSAMAVITAALAGSCLGGWIVDRYEKTLRFRPVCSGYAMTVRLADGRAHALDARMGAFSERVAKALANPVFDEVMVAGHCFGSMLTPIILHDALAGLGAAGPVARPALLGLADASPHGFSVFAKYDRVQRVFRSLAKDERIQWLNIYCRFDRVSYQKCDPVRDMLGLRDAKWPVFKSMRLQDMLSSDRLRQARGHYWRLHFHYLRDGNRPAAYSLLNLFCGARPMMKNFGPRAYEEPEA